MANAHALVGYYDVLPEAETPPEWEDGILGDFPWPETFNRSFIDPPNAGKIVKSHVVLAKLPEVADEDCPMVGDRLRFARFILEEMPSLPDHPLRVLATEEKLGHNRVYPKKYLNPANQADGYAQTIIAWRCGADRKPTKLIAPAKQVLLWDEITGMVYWVSPKVLVRDYPVTGKTNDTQTPEDLSILSHAEMY